jgi:hypothetical protein
MEGVGDRQVGVRASWGLLARRNRSPSLVLDAAPFEKLIGGKLQVVGHGNLVAGLCFSWRSGFGGMQASDVRRLKHPEQQTGRILIATATASGTPSAVKPPGSA